ncbi:MAG: hypothetical protein AAF570_07870 [Bacteroidota bacterium]
MRIFLFCLLICGLAACKSQPKPDQPDPPVTNVPDKPDRPDSPKKPDLPSSPKCMAVKTGKPAIRDHVNAENIQIVDNCLEFTVSYGGGCQEHDFDLYWTAAWAESIPPQTQLYLTHNAHDDRCRAYFTKQIRFSLSELTYPGQKKVTLNISDGESNLASVNYEY